MLIPKFLNLLLELINALFFTMVGDTSEPPPFLDIKFEPPRQIVHVRMTRPCWTLPLHQRSGQGSESMTNMTEGPHSCTSLCRSWNLKKTVRGFGTMPKFVKTAVTNIHRCDSCVM